MKCPICGMLVQNGHICDNCNENVYVLNKIFNISVRFYNKALQKANNKDFSNAILLLNKSLYFNKNNLEARNLLGLLYYHTGRLGDAVKQWVLSSNINENKTNKAFHYLDIFNNDIRSFEKQDDAVRLYNQAIKYLKNKNDDLAVIRLKKALDINPNFIDAMNLLAFCYIVQRKYKKALKVLHNVLVLDKNNEIANRYINEIENKRKKNKEAILEEEYTYNGMVKTVDEDEDYSKVNTKSTGLMIILSFCFGVLLCGLCMYFLFIPDYVDKKNQEIQGLSYEIKIANEEINNVTAKKDEDIKVLQQENENLKKQLQIYIDKENINYNYGKIEQALGLYKKGQKTDAKNVINSIIINGFTEQQLKEFNEAKNKIK